MIDNATTSLLIQDLHSLLASTGNAALPSDRREEVVALLTLNFADPEKLSAYVRALKSSRSRFSPDIRTKMINGPHSDVPWDQIRAEGFAHLSDEVLADLATSPEALLAINTMLLEDDEDVGEWFYNGILNQCAVHSKDKANPDGRVSRDVLRNIVHDICIPAAADEGERSKPSAIRDEAIRLAYGRMPPEGALRLEIYDLISAEIRGCIVEIAANALGRGRASPVAETRSDSMSPSMTLPLATNDPERVLKLDKLLYELAEDDPDLARTYSLSEFTGLSPDEIAVLLNRPVNDVVGALQTAQTHFSLALDD